MIQRLQILIFFSLIFLSSCSQENKLSRHERQNGWQLLFDGTNTSNWRAAYQTGFPKHGWIIEKGVLKGHLSTGAESGDAGDIVSVKKYRNFILLFDWKLGPGGNSGVKYFVEERLPRPVGSQPGYEYQLIDDAGYIYNGQKLPQDLKTASIYDVAAAEKGDTRMNSWHRSSIVVTDHHIEHWLDGKKVLDIDRTGNRFINGVQDSKFKDYKGFDAIAEGHILLQDHGHNVEFKNIKIKEL